jgi:membrane protease YdiL (CAAX protease family)
MPRITIRSIFFFGSCSDRRRVLEKSQLRERVSNSIFRGYLILRLKAITASPAAAALLSDGIFSLGHGYEGSAGVVTVGFMGLVFALVYMWRESLVAPIVMHFLQDFIVIVLLPLFGKG